MKFADLHPYKKPFGKLNRAKFFFAEKVFDRKMFTEKDEVDALFEQLSGFENNPEGLREASETLLENCEILIRKQLLLRDRPMSCAIIALTFAAKMEIYSRLGQQGEIRKNYSDFCRADDAVKTSLGALSDLEKKYISFSTSNLAKLKKDLIPQLNCTLPLKDGVTLPELSVPDALASASFICEDDFNKNHLRKIFHELWQVKALQPLMTNLAYAACGHYCGDRIKDREKLKLVFSNKLLSGYFDSNTGSGLSQGDVVWISLAGNNAQGLDQPRSDTAIKNTVIHELHHFWEKFSHDSYSALPYSETPLPPKKRGLKPSQVTPLSDPDEEIKKMLREMCKEAEKVGEENSIKIRSRFNGYATTDPEPYHTFHALSGYPKDDRTRHVEIVVRVPASLAGMVGEGGCTEARAFELMNLSGLTKCVDFFRREQERMRKISGKMGEEFGTFAAAKPITEMPDYAKDSSSTPLHEAVRNRVSIKELVEEIETSDNPNAKDGLGQTALELAMNCDDPKLVFAFLRSPKVLAALGKDLTLLRRLAFYLVARGMNDDDPESSETACALFREAMSKTSGTPWKIFYEARISAIDPKLVEELKTKTLENFRTELERGETIGEDRLGNSLDYYCFKADREDLKELVKNDFFVNVTTKKLVKLTPLHRAIKEKDPEKFLTAVEEMAKAGEALPERLYMDQFSDSPLKNVAMNLIKKDAPETEIEKWINVARRLVELGADPIAVEEDHNCFAKILSRSAPRIFEKFMESLPEEKQKQIQEFIGAEVGGSAGIGGVKSPEAAPLGGEQRTEGNGL
jgi:hypothetical protein